MCIDIVKIWFGIANGQISSIFIPRHMIVAGYYGFTLDVCVSVQPSVVRPSVFRFRMISWININRFSPNLVCALMLWRSDFGLLICKFRYILTELSAWDMPIFLFPDYNLCKCQWILTKLGTCIDMKEILLMIANGQICQCLTVICPCNTIMAGYYSLTFLLTNKKNIYFLSHLH